MLSFIREVYRGVLRQLATRELGDVQIANLKAEHAQLRADDLALELARERRRAVRVVSVLVLGRVPALNVVEGMPNTKGEPSRSIVLSQSVSFDRDDSGPLEVAIQSQRPLEPGAWLVAIGGLVLDASIANRMQTANAGGSTPVLELGDPLHLGQILRASVRPVLP